MANLRGIERERFVRKTFSQVARNYVCMNHLMTGGMDIVLRKETIRVARFDGNEKVLDIGTGTGDLARAAHQKHPHLTITAADFSLEMMTAGKKWDCIRRCASDALSLPFQDGEFDTVISGYLVRNVSDLAAALAEQYRVLKPGGRVVILDTTRPRHNFFTPLINLYFKAVIPMLGALLSRNREAYTYLTQSTQNFVSAETLAAAMWECGFDEINFHIRMFGTMAIHNAVKP